MQNGSIEKSKISSLQVFMGGQPLQNRIFQLLFVIAITDTNICGRLAGLAIYYFVMVQTSVFPNGGYTGPFGQNLSLAFLPAQDHQNDKILLNSLETDDHVNNCKNKSQATM